MGGGNGSETGKAMLLPVCTTQWLYRAQLRAIDLAVTASSPLPALKQSEVRACTAGYLKSEEVKGHMGG